ncbi:FMN-binding negative transcriptional regulator [Rapidithrix thailandica]|uniref:FMN-binding negative transcriptional regulator n=1 Tax=Rapidithrix thailandica TaxID=413964 RepID=A0AAW9RU72_9BACT
MYTPRSFRFTNQKEILAFMQQYSFATIINAKEGIPIATHLPFVVEQIDDSIFISSHFAKANEQIEVLENTTSLIIFSEPHAYISPNHYDRNENVPTWDYITVHAYGKAKIISDIASKQKAIEKTIAFYEKDYKAQWDGLPERFKNGMLNGIVAFEIEITELQGQKKLSQNKTANEQKKIIEHLTSSDSEVEQALGVYMKKDIAE